MSEKKVMIVDDDPHILYTIERLLGDEVELITAESGKECLERLKDDFEGVIFMDVMMPEMDGWETVEKITERYDMENVVIAMLTAKETPEEGREILQKYVVDYVRKPFTEEELKDKIEEYQKYMDD